MTINVAALQFAFINDDVVVSGENNAVSISNGDTIVIGPQGEIFSPVYGIYFGDTVSSQVGQIQNIGFIYGQDAIYINNMAGREDLSNAIGATIEGQQIGIFASLSSSVVSVNNSGYIYGTDDGIATLGNQNRIVNSGSIECSPDWREDNLFKTSNYDDFYAINLQGASVNFITNLTSGIISGAGGIFASGHDNYLNNAGSITGSASNSAVNFGSSSTIISSGSISSAAITVILSGGNDALTNSGDIFTSTEYAVYCSGFDNIVHNSGEIAATNIEAIYTEGAGAFIENSGKISASAAAVDFESGSSVLLNSGTISTLDFRAVYSLGGNTTVTSSGEINSVDRTIEMDGDSNLLQNSGNITASEFEAVLFTGESESLTNSGTISASFDDIFITGTTSAYDSIVNEAEGLIEAVDDKYFAIYVTGSPVHIINHGEITGSIFVTGASTFNNTGVFSGDAVLSGGGVTVRNSGHMTYEGAGAAADTAVFIGGGPGDDLFVNFTGGVIDASKSDSLYFAGGGLLQAYNYGEMFGGLSLNGQTTLVNTGAITGEVAFNSASSLLVNRGLIDGDVHFTGTGNIYRGQVGAIIGAIYGAGADGRYAGGAGDDAFDMTASGAAYVSGGAGDDSFTFTAAGLTAATALLGGDGLDTLSFSTAGTIAASAFAHVSSVEAIDLANGANTLTLSNALVTSAFGGALTVIGNAGHDVIDASAVVNAADTVTIYGGGGSDSITAGGAKDVFGYSARLDSTGVVYDMVTGVNLGIDRFDVSAVAGSILAINSAVTTGSLSTTTFNADLAADLPAAKLGAHDAALFTASAGTLAGQTFLVVDANGVAGYQTNADLVIRLIGATGTLTTANFV